MEPRFKKEMRGGGNQPPKKKSRYLRLGYNPTPRKEKIQEKPQKRCCSEPGKCDCCAEE